MRHAVDARDQGLRQSQSVALLLYDKWARKLRLQFLEVVVSVMTHLVANADNHQFEFVDLGDGLGRGGLLGCCLLGVEA